MQEDDKSQLLCYFSQFVPTSQKAVNAKMLTLQPVSMWLNGLYLLIAIFSLSCALQICWTVALRRDFVDCTYEPGCNLNTADLFEFLMSCSACLRSKMSRFSGSSSRSGCADLFSPCWASPDRVCALFKAGPRVLCVKFVDVP